MRLVSRLLRSAIALLLLTTATPALANSYRIDAVSFADPMNGAITGGYVVNNGFVSTTDDGGLTWSASPTSKWMTGVASDGTGGWAVASYGAQLWGSDDGLDWQIDGSMPGGDVQPSDVAVLAGGRVAVVGQQSYSGESAFIKTSDNGGSTWTDRYRGPLYAAPDEFSSPPSTKAQMQAIDEVAGGMTAWAIANEWQPSSGGDGSTTSYLRALAFKTTDGGSTWATQTMPPTGGNSVMDVAAPNATTAFAVGFNRLLMRTTNDTGANKAWTGAPGTLPRDGRPGIGQTNVNAYAVDALDANRILIGADAGRVGISTDGTTFTYQTLPGATIIRDVEMITATHWIAVGDNETIYHTFNAGADAWSGTSGLKAPTVTISAPVASAALGGSSYSIAGQSSDASGTGVADVDVTISRQDGKFFNGTTWQDAQVWLQTASADGWKNWSYSWNLEPGQAGQNTYTIVARSTDAMGLTGTASVTGVKVNNSAPGSLTGTVKTVADAPIAGASVKVSGQPTQTTDPAGAYSLTNLAPGTYSAVFSAVGYMSRTETVEIAAGSQTVRSVQLTALSPLYGSIRGVVTDGGGNPLSGVSIALGNQPIVYTNADGAYLVTNVTPGSYQLQASKDGFSSQTILGIQIDSVAETVRNITLQSQKGALAGVVTLNGQLQQGVSIKVDGVNAATTAADGTYSVSSITPGSRTINISHPGYVAQQRTVNIVAGQTASLSVDLAIQPPAPTPVVPERISGTSRFSGSAKIARDAFDTDPNTAATDWNVRNVVIASGEDRAAADPLSAAGLCGVLNAPLLLVSSSSVDGEVEKVIKEIAASTNDPVNVYIVGGLMSVPDARFTEIQQAVGSSGTVVKKRLATGGTRYDMAATIARKMREIDGAAPSTVLVANGADPAKFFDALALSPISARQAYPILLVSANAVPPATQSVINELDPSRVIVGGGPNTVSAGIVTGLGAVRWSGSTRYSTALAIADKAVAEAGMSRADVGVAAVLPDALTGGSAVGMAGGVLVLTDGRSLTSETGTWLSKYKTQIKTARVFGGPNSLSDSVKNSIQSRLAP